MRRTHRCAACCSAVNLAYFPLGVVAPLRLSLLIAEGLTDEDKCQVGFVRASRGCKYRYPGVLIISNYNALTQISTESFLSLMGLTYGTNFPGVSSQSGLKKHLGRLFGSICFVLYELYHSIVLLFCTNPPVFVLCLRTCAL